MITELFVIIIVRGKKNINRRSNDVFYSSISNDSVCDPVGALDCSGFAILILNANAICASFCCCVLIYGALNASMTMISICE